MGDGAVIRGAAIVTCSVLAVACVGVFLGSAAPVALAVGVGGNIAANWIDKQGPDKLRSLLSGPLSLPRHDDMVRVADLALSAAIGAFLKEIECEAASEARTDFEGGLRRLREQAASHTTRLRADAADHTIAQALNLQSSHGPAQALNNLLIDSITPDMRRGGDGAYSAAWQTLTNRLRIRLPALLSAHLAEALKRDERFFRAVTLSLHTMMLRTGQDVLSALQEQSERLAALHADLTARLPQNEGLDLTGFCAAVTQGLEVARIAAWEWHSSQSSNPDSLIYYHRHAAFVGRDAAMDALNRFLDAPDRLLWTIVNGPAGVGKSRLVLEALAPRRLLGQVDAWFLNMTKVKDWNYAAWQAPRPTVLVIDYASVDADWVRGLLTSLKSGADNGHLRSPVRVLLLDTLPYDGQFSLHSRITGGSEGGSLAMEVEWKGDRHPLNLTYLKGETDIRGIIQHFRHGPLTAEETKRVAAALGQDRQLARPLFAALMGLALRHGANSPLTLAGVTSHFLDRQEKHWADRDQITQLDRTLLALATLGGSVPLVPVLREIAPPPANPDRKTLRQHWSVMTGKPFPTESLTKLEPDYVGGLYLLRHLIQTAPGDSREADEVAAERDRLITLAWKHGDPREPLVNLARNFAGVADWVGLVTDLALYRPPGADGERWARMVPDLTLTMAQRGADAAVDRLLDALAAGDGMLDKEMLAFACFNSGLASELGIHPRADDSLHWLRKLAAANPDNAAIALPLAMGLVNAVDNAGTDNVRVDGLLDDLRTLVGDPDQRGNADIALELAKGLVNAVGHAGTDTGRVERLLGDLRTLVDKHSGNAGIALERAKGLVNAVSHAGTDTDRVEGLLGDLRALVDKHQGNAEIARYLAMGLFNAANNAGTETVRVDRLLGDLHTLVYDPDHRGDAAIALPLAMALVNATNKAGTYTKRMDRLLGDLLTLVGDHRDNADFAQWLAGGLFNALYYGHGDDDAHLRELSELAAAYPDVEMIQKAVTLAPEAIARREANRGG